MPALRSAVRFGGFLLLALASPAVGFTAEQAPGGSLRSVREPGGGLLYYAKADYAYPSPENDAVIANPHVAGALFQIIWSEVEKEQGQCDWREVDRWIRPWLAAGKKIALRVLWSTSGAWPKSYYKTPTPAWVYKKGAVFTFHPRTQTQIPLIWDPIYKEHAWRFLEQLASKYGSNPGVVFIDVTPGAETNPFRFGTIHRLDPGFKDQFLQTATSDGRRYSDALWMDTLKEWLDASSRAMPAVPLLVTLNVGGLPGSDRLVEIGDLCVRRGYYVGQNGLAGRSYVDAEAGRTRAFLRWSGQSRLFFEMVQRSGGRTGSLMSVMQAAERIHCSYLNVYPEDVRQATRGTKDYDPAFEEALKYGAAVLARLAAGK